MTRHPALAASPFRRPAGPASACPQRAGWRVTKDTLPSFPGPSSQNQHRNAVGHVAQMSTHLMHSVHTLLALCPRTSSSCSVDGTTAPILIDPRPPPAAFLPPSVAMNLHAHRRVLGRITGATCWAPPTAHETHSLLDHQTFFWHSTTLSSASTSSLPPSSLRTQIR